MPSSSVNTQTSWKQWYQKFWFTLTNDCPSLSGWFWPDAVYGETLKYEPLSFTGITLHKKIIQSMLKQGQETAKYCNDLLHPREKICQEAASWGSPGFSDSLQHFVLFLQGCHILSGEMKQWHQTFKTPTYNPTFPWQWKWNIPSNQSPWISPDMAGGTIERHWKKSGVQTLGSCYLQSWHPSRALSHTPVHWGRHSSWKGLCRHRGKARPCS